jgi:hypothetical protein
MYFHIWVTSYYFHHHHRQNSPSGDTAFLGRFCQIVSGFHFFGFRNSNFLTEQGRYPCVQPPNWRTRSLYLCPPMTGWPSYIPRHRVPFSSPSTTRRAMVEGHILFSSTKTHILWQSLCRHMNVNTIFVLLCYGMKAYGDRLHIRC